MADEISAVPGGAPAPADPIRSGLRARLSSLQGHDTLCLPVGEIRDLVAALDVARADVEQLRHDLSRLEWAGMLAEQTCRAGRHVTWYVDDEGAVACPWCRRDEARADVERLSAQRADALSDCRDLQREVELLRGQVGAWDSAQAMWDAIGRIRKSLGGDTDV